ncbi:lamin tail domain-containing protein, partial [Akkermansiaceae bacterium]|nr:lamin tail domain-containing protein [Akkermansiaceae bacterium]
MKTILAALLLTLPLFSQVRINELMASNTRSVPDITDFEDYPDWIELHNAGADSISLSGYFLSDNPDSPFKWPFPAGTTIDAGGYLMIMADGHDAGPG